MSFLLLVLRIMNKKFFSWIFTFRVSTESPIQLLARKLVEIWRELYFFEPETGTDAKYLVHKFTWIRNRTKPVPVYSFRIYNCNKDFKMCWPLPIESILDRCDIFSLRYIGHKWPFSTGTYWNIYFKAILLTKQKSLFYRERAIIGKAN